MTRKKCNNDKYCCGGNAVEKADRHPRLLLLDCFVYQQFHQEDFNENPIPMKIRNSDDGM